MVRLQSRYSLLLFRDGSGFFYVQRVSKVLVYNQFNYKVSNYKRVF